MISMGLNVIVFAVTPFLPNADYIISYATFFIIANFLIVFMVGDTFFK